ncbi:hypothetical protein GOM46_07390 [Streptococcus infantis]|nr:hypothetical protein [Streptococcus infantis]UJD04382.1 hypothetical protein GOM46_07390 [Streptococcus infantis]
MKVALMVQYVNFFNFNNHGDFWGQPFLDVLIYPKVIFFGPKGEKKKKGRRGRKEKDHH